MCLGLQGFFFCLETHGRWSNPILLLQLAFSPVRTEMRQKKSVKVFFLVLFVIGLLAFDVFLVNMKLNPKFLTES